MTADERKECVKLKDEIKSLKKKLLEQENLYYKYVDRFKYCL